MEAKFNQTVPAVSNNDTWTVFPGGQEAAVQRHVLDVPLAQLCDRRSGLGQQAGNVCLQYLRAHLIGSELGADL